MTVNHTTISFCGLELEIEFEYAPAEPAVRYYADYSGYPGCGEHLQIIDVKLGDQSIFELCEKYKMFDDLEERMRKTR